MSVIDYPTLDIKITVATPTYLPSLRVNEGEKEKEGGREGGRSLSYYGKSGCSSCTLPDLKVLSGAGASFCEAAGIYSC